MNDFFKRPFASYTSNSFKNLAETCIENIHAQHISCKTYLAYPSNEGKEYFIQTIIEKNSHLFGIRFITLQQFVHLALKICYKKDLLFPSHYELMFFLEEGINSLIDSNILCAKPLQEYIEGKKERIIPLASNLSHIFLEYLLYGKDALPSWLSIDGWSQHLFKQVLAKWTCIIDAIKHCPQPPFPLCLHIFGLDEIPKLYLEFIEKLSPHISCSFYFFSPSPLFWGDLISRKKSAYLDKLFQKKQISLEQRIEFANHAENAHPLLSHFCEGGKALYRYLHEHGSNEDYVDIEMKSNLTYIQKALLYQIKPTSPPYPDKTFTVHSAPSLLREVEVLIANILTTLQLHLELTPSDIAVLAPDIDVYYPFISYLFASKNYPFTFAISNLQKTKHCPTMSSLKELFGLIDSRFEKDAILKLFSSPLFQRKCQINQEDVEILEKIIHHTGIRWGFDSKFKSSILNEQACSFGLFEKGFSTMLDLITAKNSSIEFSQAESIGDVITLVTSLHQEICLFLDHHYTLEKWTEKTINFAEKFLYLDESADGFFKELKKISTLSKTSTFTYSFKSFKRLLFEIFAKKGASDKMYETAPITFSSMENSPPVNKAIFFIGLDEENYPRKEPLRSLHELSAYPSYDKSPSPAKKARTYLLRAIMTAKCSVCFSYTSNNPSDGRAQNPSPLLEEIIHALSLPPLISHPFTPFSPAYFLEQNVFVKNYNLYLASKKPPLPIYSYEKVTILPVNKRVIEIKDLQLLARSPAQFFYNLSASLFEHSISSQTLFDDSEFILSYLDRAVITKEKSKEETVDFELLTSTNKLPTAIFQIAAKKELTFSIQTEKSHLKRVFKSTNPYFSFHLNSHIKAPLKKGTTTFLPAISVTVNEISTLIQGSIHNLTEVGLVSFKKSSPAEIWKLLPSLIILSHLDTNIPLAISFLKEGLVKRFDRATLKSLLPPLLLYYQKALENISPLIPEAIDEYVSKHSISFDALKAKLLLRFKDPYLTKGEPKNYNHFEEELVMLTSVLEGESNEIV